MKININQIEIKERVRKDFPNINELAESIKELGLLQPILITNKYELIAGHRRLLACKKLGLNEIECNIINPNNELHKLDMELAENVKREDFNPMELARGLAKRKQLYEAVHPETKVGQFGYKGIKTTEKSDSDSSGVDRFTLETAKKIGKSETFIKEHLILNDLKEDLQKKIESNEIDKSKALAIHRKEKKIEKIKENTKSFDNKNLKVYCGDCLDLIDTKIKDKSVACIIIDPPYGIDYQSNYKLAKYNKIENDKEEAFSLLKNTLHKLNNKLLDDSHLYIFTSWKVYDKVKDIVEEYFEVKNCLIWNKNNWSMGDLKGNYAEKYEMIIFAKKGKRDLLSTKRPVNVLEFNRTTNKYHPTEKPIDLLKELISNSTVEGELVLDCFSGSGSTLLAAKQLNRDFIGFEKEEVYFKTSIMRLKE